MASGGDSTSGESTPEYLAFKKSYRKVIGHVKEQPLEICNAFFEKGFITSEVRDKAKIPGIADCEKASRLIDALIDKIKNNPDVFNGFMEILEKEGPSADDLVKTLKEKYAEEIKEHSREDSCYSLPDTDTPNDQDSLQRLRSEESDSACDQKVNEQSATEEHHSSFPYLDLTKIKQNERDALKVKLSRDINKIKRLYARTENDILTALEMNVDLGKLQNYIISLVQGQCTPEQIERLRNSDTVYKLSADLSSFKSFFNYDIIKDIVETFGSDNEEKRLMGDYEFEFKEFCKRSVFEVPPHIFHPSGTDDKCYAFKHSSKLHPPSLGDVLLLKENLADILHMESKNLKLKSITDGCVCLHFLIPANVAKSIFPLSELQVSALRTIQVTFLGCVNEPETDSLSKMAFTVEDANQSETESPLKTTFSGEDDYQPETDSLPKIEKDADQSEILPKMIFSKELANQPETESLPKAAFSEEDAYQPKTESLPNIEAQSKVDSKTDAEIFALKDEDDPNFSKPKLRELVNQLLERPIEIQDTPLHVQKENKLPRAPKTVSPAKERELKFETQCWEIEIAKKVALFFKDKSLPQHLKQVANQTLHQLSSGKWNEEIHRPVKSNNGIILYSADLVEAASIIYQVLVRFSQHLTETPKDHVYTDTIIVWDAVLNHGALNHAAEDIRIAIQNLQSPPRATQLQKTGLLTKPTQYTEKEVYELFSRKNLTDIGTKTYSVTTDLMLSFLDDENERRDYPIKVTEEEHDIIMLPSNKPIIVLGRSGTGKTTICLNRLWLNFRNHMKRVNANQKQQCSSTQDGELVSSSRKELPCLESLHQVFITKNYALCIKMKKLFYDFVAGCQHTAHYLPHENDALPEKLFELQHFPIFVTAKQFFTMLDKSLEGKRFFEPGVTVESSTNQADSRSLNQLFEIPYDDSDNDSDDEDYGNQVRRERQNKKVVPMKEITADEFATETWPQMSKRLQDIKIDPLLIWTEIESFIEGSTQALEREKGFLSEEDYLKIGLKQAPPLEREEVYKLFMEYRSCIKHKDIRKCRFSNGELIAKLSQRLQVNIPWSINEIYIDEVQDFTQAELSVILRCCQDPNRSFLAGDTAQTIMKGISFRFEDLRSLFHNLKCTVPEVHKLTKNYRSHSSITDLASSVTELLKEYFRDDFDLLSPDESNIIGPKPLFICSKTLLDNFLLSQSTSNVSSIEFGADQVVIARDSSEQGNKRMPDYLQDEIVLNVQESKGLEFNDVLLYNFFTDTPKQQNQDMWRISAQYLADHPDKVILEEAASDIHPLGYDKRRHRSFCAELKILYTMVTRAKRHIWIYEDSPLENLPMIKYWQRRNLITLVSRDDSELPKQSQLEKSSIEEWKKQGDIYMQKKLWHAAKKCYQKAGEAPLENIAYARALEQKALRTKQTDVAQFRYVAALFIRCSLLAPQKEHVKNAAICLYRAKMYVESSKLFEMIREYKHAIHICKEYLKSDVDTLVRLYEKSGRYKSAVKLYLRKRKKYGPAIKMALKYLPKDDCYDLLKDIVYKVAVDGTHREDILRFVKILPKTKAMEQVHLLKLAKMYEEACELLQKGGKYKSAYRIRRAQHLYTKGIEIAENAGPHHTNTKHSLILLRAEHHITTNPAPWGDEQNDLKKILEVKDLRGRHKAKAMLLLSVTILNNGHTDDVQDALELCSTAYKAYKNVRSNAGEIETFCILNKIKEKRKEYTLNHSKMIINTLTVLRQMCALLTKPAAAFTPDVKDAEDFYGLEKYGSHLYFISRQENYFFPLQQDQIRDIDSDGMLQLEQKDTLSNLLQHYKKCEDVLIQYLFHFKASWHNKVKQSFTFHNALLKAPFYLQQPYRRYPKEQINRYLRMCETALQIHQMNSAIFQSSNDVIRPINWILSPFSQLNLTFEKENFLLMAQESDAIKGLLKERATKELTMMARNISDIPNIDNWLEVWRLIYVLGKDSVAALTAAIHKQVAAVNDTAKTSLGYDPTIHTPLTYVRTNKYSYESIFTIWERSCKLYRENGDALVATSHSFTYFIQVIANRRSLHQTLSLENLINILTIQCTALFAIISVSQYRNQRPITIVIPESFERMVKSFDLFNCMGQIAYTELLQTCTSQEVPQDPDQLIQDGTKLLISILNLISGRYNKDYCPLQKAASQGTNTEAIHMMVLALTIIGNLIAQDVQTIEIQLMLDEIMRILHSRGLLSTKLKTIQSTKDLYDDVIHPLLKQADLQLMTMQTVSSLGKEQIRIKPYFSHKVPVTGLNTASHELTHQAQCNEQGEVSLSEAIDSISATSPIDSCTQETVQNLELSAKNDSPENSDEEHKLVYELEESGDEESGEEEVYHVEDIVEDFSTATDSEVQQYKRDSKLAVDEQEDEFLNGNYCILCEETAHKNHFTSTSHSAQKKLYGCYKNAEMTYNFTQKHLKEKILECRIDPEYTDYELEQKIQEAEQMIKSNNQKITKMYEEKVWEKNTQELEKMRDITQKVIAGLDDKHKEILESQKQKIDDVDKEKSEEDDYDDEELAKAKLTSSSKKKTHA